MRTPLLAPPSAIPRWRPGVASHGRLASSGGGGESARRAAHWQRAAGVFCSGSEREMGGICGKGTGELGERHGVARRSTRCEARHARCAAPFRADAPPSPLPYLPCKIASHAPTLLDVVPSCIALRQLRTMAPLAMTEIVAREDAHGVVSYSVAFSPDGKTIVSGSADKTIKVWDAGANMSNSTSNRPSWPKTDACWLAWQLHWS